MPEIFTQPKKHHAKKPEQIERPSFFQPVNVFSTFVHHPKDVSFTNQENNEVVELFLRRDFITNVPWLIISFLLLFVPGLIYAFFNTNGLPLNFVSAKFLVFFTIFYYLIVLGYAFFNFTSWFYNIGLVTTKRVIDIDFNNLSSKHVAATVLEEIEDVNYSQNGFFASFFDFGTVTATTVSGRGNFVFNNIPSPGKVVDILSGIIGEQK